MWNVVNDGVTPGLVNVSTGRVLLTNYGCVAIEYIGLVLNLAIWSALALEAFICLLASRTAAILTKDPKLGAHYEERALGWIQEARRQDQKEGTPIRLRQNAGLLHARLAVGRPSLGGWWR